MVPEPGCEFLCQAGKPDVPRLANTRLWDRLQNLPWKMAQYLPARAFGASGEVDGEVCFNTSMTGYQEILTDPSYRGQIVTMTYPEIGNYGVNAEDVESHRPHLAGFIVRERSRRASNFRADGELHDYLAALRHRRHGGHRHAGPGPPPPHPGAMKSVLSTVDLDDASLVAKAKASPGLVGRDLVREVIPERSAAMGRGP